MTTLIIVMRHWKCSGGKISKEGNYCVCYCYSRLCESIQRCHSWDGAVLLTCFGVLMGKHVVGQRGRIGQTLQSRVEKASVAQILKAGSHAVHLLPLQADLLGWKEKLLWHANAVCSRYRPQWKETEDSISGETRRAGVPFLVRRRLPRPPQRPLSQAGKLTAHQAALQGGQ